MSRTVTVKNLNGTSDRTPPKGYKTWKEYWEDEKGDVFWLCSCTECDEFAEVGAHVQKAGSGTEDTWYIVPLCNSCNVSRKNEEFEVLERDLVRAVK